MKLALLNNPTIKCDPLIHSVACDIAKNSQWVLKEAAQNNFDDVEIPLAHVTVNGRKGLLKLKFELDDDVVEVAQGV